MSVKMRLGAVLRVSCAYSRCTRIQSEGAPWGMAKSVCIAALTCAMLLFSAAMDPGGGMVAPVPICGPLFRGTFHAVDGAVAPHGSRIACPPDPSRGASLAGVPCLFCRGWLSAAGFCCCGATDGVPTRGPLKPGASPGCEPCAPIEPYPTPPPPPPGPAPSTDAAGASRTNG